MLILSQNREVMVNVNNLQGITICNMRDCKQEFRILAWYGTSEDDCWGLGDYSTEVRVKEVIREIWGKYGEYLHREGYPAILRGSIDIPETFLILPKIYEMPVV